METPSYHVELHPRYGLGNFINLTPTLQWLGEHDGPVPVLFHGSYIADCFRDAHFIRSIDRPIGARLFGSELIDEHNTGPDYDHVFRKVTGIHRPTGLHTYVDRPADAVPNSRVILINGGVNSSSLYIDRKDPGAAPYLAALERFGDRCLFVGNEQDRARNPWSGQCASLIGDVRAVLAAIAGADLVIANDTGLAHATAALRKPLLLLWKDTLAPRCVAMGAKAVMPAAHVNAVRTVEPRDVDIPQGPVFHRGPRSLLRRLRHQRYPKRGLRSSL